MIDCHFVIGLDAYSRQQMYAVGHIENQNSVSRLNGVGKGRRKSKGGNQHRVCSSLSSNLATVVVPTNGRLVEF